MAYFLVADSGTDKILLTIDEIYGILDHSEECEENQVMTRNPATRLHPELREFAMSLIRNNIPLTQIQLQCRNWAHNRWGANVAGDAHYRYLLNNKESTSLYRTHYRELGIPQRSGAEENLDRWFRSTSPQPPDPLLSEACLHYVPHIEGVSDRFEIILSTQKQRAVAWEHGHQKQVIMDLTFGFCAARTLLAILLVMDKSGQGLPVALIIFTARKEAKATHADYNGQLLSHLLEKWKHAMGKHPVTGEEFSISVANTDNDARERHALQANWPDILLILCMFHTYQAWRNGLNRYLRVIPQGQPRNEVRKRLGGLLMCLLREIVLYDEAINAYNAEVAFFKDLRKEGSVLDKKKAKGGLAFLTYLRDYLKLESYWRSWSKAGAIKAAEVLGVPVNKIPRTTNHIESFNGRIKGKYFAAYRRSGRLPRIDMWILTVVTKVLPSFFEKCQDKTTLNDYFARLRHIGPLTITKTNDEDAHNIDNIDDEKMLEDLLDDSNCISDDTEEDQGPETEFDIELGKMHKSVDTMPPDSPLTPLPPCYDDSIVEETQDDIEMQPLAMELEDNLVSNRATLPDRSNEAVTCMQRLLLAEDELAREIELLLQITSNPHLVAPHVSPAIRARIRGAPEGSMDLPLLSRHSPEHLQRPSTPPNPMAAGLPAANERIVPFARQNQRRRYESHGIR
jgi:hypothetical protein